MVIHHLVCTSYTLCTYRLLFDMFTRFIFNFNHLHHIFCRCVRHENRTKRRTTFIVIKAKQSSTHAWYQITHNRINKYLSNENINSIFIGLHYTLSYMCLAMHYFYRKISCEQTHTHTYTLVEVITMADKSMNRKLERYKAKTVKWFVGSKRFIWSMVNVGARSNATWCNDNARTHTHQFSNSVFT